MVTAYTRCFGGLMLFGDRLADVLGAHRTVLAVSGAAVSAGVAPFLVPRGRPQMTGG